MTEQIGHAVPEHCHIDGCERAVSARGLCKRHYERWRLWGDPYWADPTGPAAPPLADRFWAKVDTSGDCWIWTASVRNGYGQFGTPEGIQPAHRVAWTLANGDIPDGLIVCHRCDNPPCVRPDHLFLGTQLDNVRDMIDKGRAAFRERHPNARLTASQAAAIRTDTRKQKAIADDYGISQTHVSHIKRGLVWSDV